VFEGNTADPRTLAAQVDKAEAALPAWACGARRRSRHDRPGAHRRRHHTGRPRLDHSAACACDRDASGERRITTVGVRPARPWPPSRRPSFPSERLVVCRNPDLAAQPCRKRAELLAAAEGDLTHIQTAVHRDPLRGAAEISLPVGAVINRHKMGKHFALDISDTSFSSGSRWWSVRAHTPAWCYSAPFCRSCDVPLAGIPYATQRPW
jgi:hypothetical protein